MRPERGVALVVHAPSGLTGCRQPGTSPGCRGVPQAAVRRLSARSRRGPLRTRRGRSGRPAPAASVWCGRSNSSTKTTSPARRHSATAPTGSTGNGACKTCHLRSRAGLAPGTGEVRQAGPGLAGVDRSCRHGPTHRPDRRPPRQCCNGTDGHDLGGCSLITGRQASRAAATRASAARALVVNSRCDTANDPYCAFGFISRRRRRWFERERSTCFRRETAS